MSLHPQTGYNAIVEAPLNRCIVSVAGIEKEFTGISEKDYDKLVPLHDWREIKQTRHFEDMQP